MRALVFGFYFSDLLLYLLSDHFGLIITNGSRKLDLELKVIIRECVFLWEEFWRPWLIVMFEIIDYVPSLGYGAIWLYFCWFVCLCVCFKSLKWI